MGRLHLVLLVLLVAAGCGGSTLPSTDSPAGGADSALSPATHSGPFPFTVVTTCGMVTDIVREVAGEHANVVGLMGEGVDPHLYKPTRNDVKQLLEADLIFYSGLMLEGRMTDAFARIGRQGKPVYAVTEQLEEDFLLEPPEMEGHWDPHVWMDAEAWSACAGFVARALAAFDPAHASDYERNAAAYREQLARLHEWARETIATIPQQQRVLVTAHDAFGYFSRAYEIPVRAVQGITTESEAGVDDVNQLVDFIVERKLKAIFVESSVSQKNIQAVLEGARQRGWDVAIGGELYSDAMGQPGTYEGTYIGMIDHNVTTIARALGGRVSDQGFQGKLTGQH